jgi:CheY-like chemotaxis protein
MSADVRSKIFSPFFSTRQGAGRGLSLSLAQAIVHQHGGTLFCRNAANRQTEFVLRLPAQDAKSPYTTEVNMTENEAPSVRVLVVDDEPAICRVVNHILKRNGFSSVSVSDPGQIQATIERDGPFDIVLLDRSMGLTQGSALLPQLRAAAPGAKVLYFTGEFVEQDEVADVDGVVQKPVNGKQLTEVLRKVL